MQMQNIFPFYVSLTLPLFFEITITFDVLPTVTTQVVSDNELSSLRDAPNKLGSRKSIVLQ